MQKFSNQLGQFRVKSESYIKQLLLNWSTYKGSCNLVSSDRSNYQEPIS